MSKTIQIKPGDVLNIREEAPLFSSEDIVNTYEVESIPKNKRFIVCVLLKNDKRTCVRKTFTRFELKECLVWGGTEVKERKRKSIKGRKQRTRCWKAAGI